MSRDICIFGEVLFDHFPDGRRVLGGAPFNVAWNLQAFGEDPLLLSRVGTDGNALSVRTAMQVWGLRTEGLQSGPEAPTGLVQVTFDDGEPSYEIVHPAAWDAIAPPDPTPVCSLLYHGSLALRGAVSRQTLQGLRAARPDTVFVDVNLRAPWWDRDVVRSLLDGADWVKLNDEELDRLAPAGESAATRAHGLMDRHGVQHLLLTGGPRGATLFTAGGDRLAARPAERVAVVDTVGAGDAFSSVMILGITRGWPLQLSLDRAQQFASAVVGQRGATVHDRGFYRPFREAWKADPAAH
ncbi:MAG: PfkB family carbohydrate kinase [Xanthomonadales bacterium]